MAAAKSAAAAAKGGIRAWLMPEINELKVGLETIRGDIKVLDQKITGVDAKIDSVRNELKVEISRVEGTLKERIESVDSSVKDLDKRLDIAQRLAIVEAKLREKEKSA